MEELKALVNSRRRVKASITRVLDWAQRAEPTTTTEITSRVDMLHTVWNEFTKLGDSMTLLDHVEGYVDPEEDNAVYEEKYLMAHSLLLEKNELLQSSHASADISNAASTLSTNGTILSILQMLLAKHKIPGSLDRGDDGATNCHSAADTMTQSELPKIDIIPFSGNYTEWPAFQDIYESCVHNNQNLTNTQKFHRLKSLLVDDAANLVLHLPLTDSAYITAWKRLMKRYNRPRRILNSFLEEFMSLPTTTKIDVSVLRKVADGTNEIVRGLDLINQTGRDCWIIFLALSKLDADTRRGWIECSRDDETPTLEVFFKFLDDRCEELELSNREITAESRPKKEGDSNWWYKETRTK